MLGKSKKKLEAEIEELAEVREILFLSRPGWRVNQNNGLLQLSISAPSFCAFQVPEEPKPQL